MSFILISVSLAYLVANKTEEQILEEFQDDWEHFLADKADSVKKANALNALVIMIAAKVYRVHQEQSKHSGQTFGLWTRDRELRFVIGIDLLSSLRSYLRELEIGANTFAGLVQEALKREYPRARFRLMAVHGLEEFEPNHIKFSISGR